MIIKVDGIGSVDIEAIGFFLDAKTGNTVRHKFGTKDLVYEWYEKTRYVYFHNDLPNIAEGLNVIEVDKLTKEEVEKMINICDYIGTFLKKEATK